VSLPIGYREQFESDVSLQATWYVEQGSFATATRFAEALESTLALLAEHPLLGIACEYSHPELLDLRVMLVRRPFQRFLLFYKVVNGQLLAVRLLDGHRQLPRRLIDPPGAE
jgi:toxin ParE1/3/4